MPEDGLCTHYYVDLKVIGRHNVILYAQNQATSQNKLNLNITDKA